MKKITSLFILVTLLISSYTINATEIEAPAEPEIKGKIIDMETDGPLEYATVSLFNSQDSTLVTGVITDSKGNFSLKAKPGKYYVVLQFIGYESKTININLKNNISLGDIVLRPDFAKRYPSWSG